MSTNIDIEINWKTVLALGAATVGILLGLKLDNDAAERVLRDASEASKAIAVAKNSNR